MKSFTFNDFEHIVLNEIPLIDVRAPIEYAKGAFLNSVNLPIMNDEERHLVGIKYKKEGNEEATKLGHKLVSGDLKKTRINKWDNFIDENPKAMLYCFRGGQRSQISQQWIKGETDREILRLEGGYKAFRNYLIDQLQPEAQTSKPILLGGCTGSGKTILLNKLNNSIDLEGLANHRGSSFGREVTPQPTPISFENNLAYNLINHRNKGYKHMILEDEGRNIGSIFFPKPITSYFKSGDMVILKVALEKRINITMDEYVYQSQKDHCNAHGNSEGLEEWANYIRISIKTIKKRFGDKNYINMLKVFEEAYSHQLNHGDFKKHRKWIQMLLEDYYDPMYNYQIKKKTNDIIFEGNTEEVLEYFEGIKL